MSKKEKNNVIEFSRCIAEGCSKKDARAGFCEEHFMWFKEGLITAKGEKVKDFDKKMQQYKARVA